MSEKVSSVFIWLLVIRIVTSEHCPPNSNSHSICQQFAPNLLPISSDLLQIAHNQSGR